MFYTDKSFRPLTCVLFFFCVTLVQAQDNTEQPEYVSVPFNVSLFPGASIGDLMVAGTDKRIINRFSITIWAGRAARLEGVESGSLWNEYTEFVKGHQIGDRGRRAVPAG